MGYCVFCGDDEYFFYLNDSTFFLDGFGDTLTCSGLRDADYFGLVSAEKCSEATAVAQVECCVLRNSTSVPTATPNSATIETAAPGGESEPTAAPGEASEPTAAPEGSAALAGFHWFPTGILLTGGVSYMFALS